MYYEDEGQGPPILLLNGAFGTIDAERGNWRRLVPTLAPRYRAIQIEARGHGRTNNPLNYLTYALLADDLIAFIEQRELGPVHIVGMSDGGIIGIAIALARPDLVRSLVGLGVNYMVDDNIREEARLLDPDRLARDRPEVVALIGPRHDAVHGEGYWRILARQLLENALANPSWTPEDLERIAAPTLMIAGEDDPFANHDQMLTMKRRIPDVEILILNNAAHALTPVSRQMMDLAIVDFLDRHA